MIESGGNENIRVGGSVNGYFDCKGYVREIIS